MKNLLYFLSFVACSTAFAQEPVKYKQFSTGINVLSGVFKNAEVNNELMLNQHIGITCDLGYQFSTSAGSNLNLKKNKIEGYYAKLGPRLYFAPHASKVSGYLAAGYIYSYFKQSASIDENDFYEPSNIKLSTSQKLEGTYFGLGSLIKMNKQFTLDFGTTFNFFSPQSINFAQDYSNATNGQPGYGNFILRNSNNFGLGIGINCSIKYEFLKH
jgi:hypothetical protein